MKIVLYHAGDLDGKCAGAILRSFLEPPVAMIGVDYDMPLPLLNYQDADVWMVDFSYPLELMFHLMNVSRSFTWIDHHAPIIKEAERVVW